MTIQIIPKTEAGANPVGEAREEPNQNPVLDTPTEGRGAADFFKGMNFNFGLCGMIMRKIAMTLLVTVGSSLFVAGFIYPGFLNK